ncbi:MAG: hypothetical protein IPP86_13410 [Bacteroidetes bacterium]|nr:hypothetical protein [Bacteroidota bacterium]
MIVPVGYTVLSGTPTISNIAVINVTGVSGQIGIKAINACGVSGTRTLMINPTPCRMSGSQKEIQKQLGLNIYPNPAHENLNIEFKSSFDNSDYKIEVVDLSGRILNTITGFVCIGQKFTRN